MVIMIDADYKYDDTGLENLEYSAISMNIVSSGNSVQSVGKFLTHRIVSV